MRRPRTIGLLATILLASSALTLTTATSAQAAPQQGIGHNTTPAQPYKGNPDKSDWLGSYMVGGRQVFCVQFAFLAPDSDEQYNPGEPLMTKWGTELDSVVAAEISYLLLRYAKTTNPDEAAALAHLLHSWTAAPQNPSQLLATNDFRHIAYDANFHLTKLPPSAQQAVDRLRADAAANHGKWIPTVTKPATPQFIGAAAPWTVAVRNEAGKGIPGVEVDVTVEQGVLADGKATGKATTTADGTVAVPVTPTGTQPLVRINFMGPADRPVVQQAIQADTQRIVSTGGEQPLTANDTTTATTPPGIVKVEKINEKTQAGIAGVSLRLTASDKVKPAKDQDGKELVGTDGKPTVLVTGTDGTVSVPNLQTPQEVCVIEVAPPAGFDKAFDPNAPPSACGTVSPGATLALTIANKPNAPIVPVTVPAGDQPQPVAYGTVTRRSSPGMALGVLVIAVGLGGFLVRRRITRRR
jgi:hypothetical protein